MNQQRNLDLASIAAAEEASPSSQDDLYTVTQPSQINPEQRGKQTNKKTLNNSGVQNHNLHSQWISLFDRHEVTMLYTWELVLRFCR